MPTLGMLLGKFLPPHRGHQYLIDFARAYADHLIVHVCSIESEPIPGPLRYAWMRDHFSGCPNVTIIHNDDPNPQTPEENPERFWDIWSDSLLKRMERTPDFVFASETYGFQLAETLGARYIPVDHARTRLPISGTMLRTDPLRHWEYLLPSARPYFVKRVALVGPESSGKSTLTAHLARRFGSVYAEEYARPYLDTVPAHWLTSDGSNGFNADALEIILRGQHASVEALTLQSTNGLIFSDTEAIVTACWAEVLLGQVPPLIDEFIRRQRYDLYLVTGATESWADDHSRVQPEYKARLTFEQRVVARLNEYGFPYRILHGTWDERTQQAETAVLSCLVPPPSEGGG